MPTGFILQPTYRVRDGRPVVQLFGVLADGAPFLVEDERFRPYFFAPGRAERHLASERGARCEATPLRDLEGGALLRVEVDVPGDVPALRERLAAHGIAALEADVRFAYRYLIDHDVRAEIEIEGTPQRDARGLLRFRDPALRAGRCRPRLRVLSIDLETSPDASRVYSVALVGAGASEVHLVSREPVPDAAAHPDERALLAACVERVRTIDPDVIVGWNVVDFDLQVWTRRCAQQRLACHLGRVEEPVSFQRDLGFTRQSRASIPGRVVLDGIGLVRDAIRLEDYRLETVARSLLGRGKLIDSEAPDAAAEITRLYREDPAALVAYNREDAQLVLDILEKEGLLELTVERSLLSGMPLDRVGASIASFDRLYLPELRRRGRVAASADPGRKSELVRGGALLEPQPGLFRSVAVFDFRSLYPSLIRTFDLDPLAHAAARPGAAIRAPNGALFAPGEGILPGVIERFLASRAEARRRGDRHADQAIKIMMNALFGVLGAASCRFFDPAIANAITGFGQQTLHWTRDAFEELGVRVLYGDTDSVFVKLDASEADEAYREAERLRDTAGARIAQRVRDEYGVEPLLELELERVFERFFLPRVRGGVSGSKKRYAGRVDGRLEIVGLESVRRDWPAVAGRLQRGMLERLFEDREVLPFVRDTAGRVLAGELDAELVYAKRIRKGSLERYTAATPPHVQAARKIEGPVGRVVRYVITDTGPEPVLPGRPLPERIDRRHYVERVLEPVADAILSHIGHSFGEAMGQPKQLPLL